MNDQEPAFPHVEGPISYRGMSLRDYFAAQALPTFLAPTLKAMIETEKALNAFTYATAAKLTAEAAYAAADSMLKARTNR